MNTETTSTMESATKRKLTLDFFEEDEDSLAKRSKNVTSSDSGSDTEETKSSDSGSPNVSGSELVQEVLMVYNGVKFEDSTAELMLHGASATKLSINYHIVDIKPLLDLVKKHCGENITELEFSYAGDDDKRGKKEFKDGAKEFKHFLVVCGGYFPNLQKLKVSYPNKPTAADMKQWEEIVQVFPSLIGLTIENCPKFPIEEFCEENPQLEQLVLNNGDNWPVKYGLLESIDEKLSDLKELRIECRIVKEANHNDFGRLRFENLQKLSVVSKHKSYIELLEFINCMGTAIEEVTIVSNAPKTTFNDATIDKIAGFKKLTKLCLEKDLDDDQLDKLLKKVPDIQELQIAFGKVSTSGVLAFIKKADKLRKMGIAFNGQEAAENSALLKALNKKAESAQFGVIVEGDDIVIEHQNEN